MTDIVEKLRLDATCSSHHEAAAEIERLRHDLTIARLDRVHAQRLVNDARGERDEAVATLAIYRMEHGCTRGQRTTQWCGEAIRLREALENLVIAIGMGWDLDGVLDVARAALKEAGHG